MPWITSSQQLSPTQSLTQSPTVTWGSQSEGQKRENMGWDKENLIGKEKLCVQTKQNKDLIQ